MKKKCFALILLAMTVFPSLSWADLKMIDRQGAGVGDDGITYEIAFVARDYAPGHAFVVWSKYRSNPLKHIDAYAYGLYPINEKKAAFGTVPGRIRGESIQSLRSVSNGLAVLVTKEMYNYALMNTEAMRGGNVDYHLFAESCVNFVELVATSLSLNVPGTSGLKNHPQAFVDALKNANN